MDEDLSHEVAVRLRAQGVDALACAEAGRNGLSDAEQLRWAGEQGRCVVTRNRDDFIHCTVQAFADQSPHAGVLIVPWSLPNNQLTRISRALLRYARAHKSMQPYTIDFLNERS